RRKVSDFCVTALTDMARRTIIEHETLVLSDRDRKVFFDALVNPPKPSERTRHDPPGCIARRSRVRKDVVWPSSCSE
ncbi:MAG: DUF1778 domain-containing protein, partial [Acidobacteria bacterium]|nr:DUF1778 domain-containing protein [Acidobacteriota bacterium]